MREKGIKGEDKAVSHLKLKGYRIVERNYRTPFGEVDVIAERDGVMIFVEVKSRSKDRAEEAFTLSKAKRLYKSAMVYLASKGLLDHPFRFDLIAISDDELEHYENILWEDGVIG